MLRSQILPTSDIKCAYLGYALTATFSPCSAFWPHNPLTSVIVSVVASRGKLIGRWIVIRSTSLSE